MKVIPMLFIPRLAVAAVAGFALVAPTSAFAETPTPTPDVPPATSVTPSASPVTTKQSVTPTPSVTPSSSPTPAPSQSATPDTERVFRAFPGGCGLVNDISTEFVRVTVFQPGSFTVEIDGTAVGTYTDHLDSGFPTGEGTVTVRVIGGGKTIAKTVEVPDTCNTTPSPTPGTPSPSPTPEATPRGVVTAKYECGAAHFTNHGTRPVLINYGPADSESDGQITLAPGKSKTVDSTEEHFGWIAHTDGDQTSDPAGYLGYPGENLSCDENDDTTVPPSATPTPKPGDARGLANTGGEGTTSVTIHINGTTITVTAPGNGKPVVTTNGEPAAVTPSETPKATTPTATPSATPTGAPTDDTQDDEIAEQQNEQEAPEQEGTQDEQAVADEIFKLTNELRTKEGLRPFERSECLDGTADQHAVTMVTTGYRHATEQEMGKMAETCPGFAGENIATGYEDAQEVFHAWETSTKGHYEAMVSTTETTMGVGVEYKDGQPFYVQHFGNGTGTDDKA